MSDLDAEAEDVINARLDDLIEGIGLLPEDQREAAWALVYDRLADAADIS